MPSHDYFQQYSDYFWQWEEEGRVLSIPGGSTVAYKEYIADAVEKLADGGLPLFGSLLLAVVATNNEAGTSLLAVRTIVEGKLKEKVSREPLNGAMAFLKQLSALPSKYKKGANRLLLLQTLFAGCHNCTSIPQAVRIVSSRSWENDEPWLKPKPFYYNLYHEEFTVVKLLAKKFPDNDSLLKALASLPVVEEEIILDGAQSQDAAEKDFIETLADNVKTFHVGSLVKRLWSGLNIPFHSTLPGRQPLGGVSDLTSKGDFHRLLVSEFAADDLLFLSRLANNEALYLNREVPPQHNNLERIVLLDVSLKNWGTPRTVAFAVMLAIAAHPKTDIPCSAFAVGEGCTPLLFGTVDEVIASLQVLEPCLHPAAGLELFFKGGGGKKNRELFFISSPDALRQPALHAVLSHWAPAVRYLIHTDSEGGVDVYRRQQAGRKHVQHLRLPLEELWKREPKQPAPVAETPKSTYPILFPSGQPKKVVHSSPDNQAFVVTSEKDLLQLTAHNRGWALVYGRLPFAGGDVQIGLLQNGQYLLLAFNQHSRELNLINLSTGKRQLTVFAEWRTSVYKNFVFHEDKFYYAHLGFPSRHWSFEWGETVLVKSYENIPPAIMAKLKEKEGAAGTPPVGLHPADVKPVFKNVKSVFINNVNNLVLNFHELRLTDRGTVRMEASKFLKKEAEADWDGKNAFRFRDGSTVTINRSGMLELKSSDAALETIYVPMVLDALLGIATRTIFAGNEYYRSHSPEQKPAAPELFWKWRVQSFIETIKTHGA